MENPLLLKQHFLEGIKGDELLQALFDHLPGVMLLAKDIEGRILLANQAVLETYRCESKSEILGLTDFDVFPKTLADKNRKDERAVIEKRKAISGITDVFLSRRGIPSWFSSNKLPIFSKGGDVIGVLIVMQPYRKKAQRNAGDPGMLKVLDHIDEHFRMDVPVPMLAEMCGLSVRQFERKFKECHQTPPQQYIIKLRIRAACEALREGRIPIAEVATRLGFYDQAAFSRQFRRHIWMTPMSYRKTFR